MLIFIVLGVSLGIVLFGNAGRWLGTILLCFGYAFSTSPQGLILAKRFIKSDFKSVANWFPGVYFTAAAIPYIIYSSLLQALPQSDNMILIVGDILSIFPQVSFPRGIGALLEISTEHYDPELSCEYRVCNAMLFLSRRHYVLRSRCQPLAYSTFRVSFYGYF